MNIYEITNILIIYAIFDLFFNHSKVISLTIFDENQFAEYYQASNEQFSYDNKIRNRKREAKTPFTYAFSITYRHNMSNAYIKRRKSDVILKGKSTLTVIEDDGKNYTEDMSEYDELYEGYMENKPHDSSISGYIEDGYFFGRVVINGKVFYIDEVKPQALRRRIVIDRPMDVLRMFNETNNPYYDADLLAKLKRTYQERMMAPRSRSSVASKQIFQEWKKRGMLCPILAVIDNSFVRVIHKGNRNAAISHVILTMEEANAIFRGTDFDNQDGPDNIGFYVKNVEVIESGTAPHYVETYSRRKTIPADQFLSKFSKYEALKNYCLGLLFTGQIFSDYVLGLAYVAYQKEFFRVGGVCETEIQGSFFNAMVASAITPDGKLDQLKFDVTVAHEIGHSFGSEHDEKHLVNCYGHIMSPEIFETYQNKKQISFSSCSRKSMIEIMAEKGACFEPVTEPFCGNTLIEEGEDCDCGVDVECMRKDPCCTTRRSSGQSCVVNKKKYSCHPSQGVCCTKKCTYAFLDNVDCKHFDMECPCENNQKSCYCGIEGQCIGSQCHSLECARLKLYECDCEKNKQKSCQICCMVNDQCVTSMKAARYLLKQQKDVEVLKRAMSYSKPKSLKGRVYEDYCLTLENKKKKKNKNKDVGKTCLRLYFFNEAVGKYCTARGSIGKCTKYSVCKIIEQRQHMFPLLESRAVSAIPSGIIPFFNIIFIKFIYLFL
ncbi:disintegrin and metalloproteinase domain-containing protein 10-like [Sitophilus oryzae]|uniref:Disintegrin and metalloproteinase domain-containing protein 10-like n=1 Tax=Sitophilus oryzae TaxID=7048 RepID=A0A6J2X3I3_SITOR|nr:disintegrin and metalloproteinase domain-containing protein 10-like [Sitophilus oryzae]